VIHTEATYARTEVSKREVDMLFNICIIVTLNRDFLMWNLQEIFYLCFVVRHT
jgi:hypothetical protein